MYIRIYLYTQNSFEMFLVMHRNRRQWQKYICITGINRITVRINPHQVQLNIPNIYCTLCVHFIQQRRRNAST